jgi:hypothetical protein
VQAITILFQNKTALSFDLDPVLTVFPELSDWKTGNWKGIKRWRAIHSKPFHGFLAVKQNPPKGGFLFGACVFLSWDRRDEDLEMDGVSATPQSNVLC